MKDEGKKMRRQYRRLTPQEKDYIICNYVDDTEAINQIAIHLNLQPKKVRDHARYLKLTPEGTRHSWSEAELELLDLWAETKPKHEFVRCWNQLAACQGRPKRSLRTIESKLLKRGHSTKVEINYYSVPTIAKLLNRSESWIKYLIENGKLKAMKEGAKWIVKTKDLRKFIRGYPYESTARLSTEQFGDLLLIICNESDS